VQTCLEAHPTFWKWLLGTLVW